MGDVTIPTALLVALCTVLAAAFGALWKAWADSRNDVKDWTEKWAKEVRRGPELLMKPPPWHGRPPDSMPPPDWEEDTKTRQTRSREEQAAIDEAARRYVSGESTPPDGHRPRIKSRPR